MWVLSTAQIFSTSTLIYQSWFKKKFKTTAVKTKIKNKIALEINFPRALYLVLWK